ncbi:hypothetical protein QLQ12_42575 [Actinoplanes sp. NEAU-A12]|uniref:Uncharacterized protein n=1 Tax=Actinoplanes sandaracinus TaxID=3045177 RepID=A0ABT6WZW2_9ACTN|nr:hypothetical protein [Actinoplanes sandaracinus]MDI6105288.1 hypothetical protein [Actinoplanes sandaracinus]
MVTSTVFGAAPRSLHRFYRRRRAVALARAGRAFATALSAERAAPETVAYKSDLALIVGVPPASGGG